MKRAAVCGGGGFIGSHLVTQLKKRGYWVRAIDLKYPEYNLTKADEFFIADLRLPYNMNLLSDMDEVYQLAADMGGAGYIFTGDHDADVMHNSATINLNVCEALKHTKTKVFYSSSACMYPCHIQAESDSAALAEYMAYPANPDSEYGWEKLFSERLYMSYERNYGLDIRIARFHNIFGTEGTWNNGKEKYPSAISRKVAEAKDGDTICIWGDGEQTRSFLNVDECINCIFILMGSDVTEPLNIGSDEMISCNDLAKMVIEISGKDLKIEHDLTKPQGVRGRNSDNTLIKEKLGYAPEQNLREEMIKLYYWIESKIEGENLKEKRA